MKPITLLSCALALSISLGCQAQPAAVAGGTGVGVAAGHSHALPKHALVGYLHNFDNGQGLLPVAQVDDSWDVIVLAFADDMGEGKVAFNPDPKLDRAQLIADIAAKRAQGKIVVLSFGGELGTVTLNTQRDEDNFVRTTAEAINTFGLDGIDVDLEKIAGVTHGAPVVPHLISAVKRLHAMYPDLYVSMAPEHPYVQGGYVSMDGIWGAYLPLIDGLRGELDLLHVQLYNNGGLPTPYRAEKYPGGSVDMMVGSAKMLIEGFDLAGGKGRFEGLRAEQVALALPSGLRAANNGYATPADINRAFDCLTTATGCDEVKPSQPHPDFRGVMTWSINWDVSDKRAFSQPVGAHLRAASKR
ncbi:chitinase [Stenotrophomonas sp. SY1]|uniref:chitinase n=1 Tax=Stenotrophomonas sp. SY1 TaxID=477235 RepID=UPI001E5524DA|nr:chitinase [Stenotrophomonas sp. SY1]MCD9085722.1 chitinase [Stenotrophomonas sp. SY1]